MAYSRNRDATGIDSLERLRADVVACRRCPRLVAWREEVARRKRAAFVGWGYRGRPGPGLGAPPAPQYVLGLAPAAHGGNRTGRVFTGDRSGDWLYASLHRCGFANQARSESSSDGLRLCDAYVAAAVRCAPPANRPTVEERESCAPFLVREVGLLTRLRVVVALGGFAWDAALRHLGPVRPKPRFGHGAETPLPGGGRLLGSYHPSQQNTFTGRLTQDMFDSVFRRARDLLRSKEP